MADTARTERPLSLSLSPCSSSPFRSGHRDRTSRTDEAQASGARCSVLRARPRLISQSKPKNSVVKRTGALNRALDTYGRSVGAREFANRGCVGVEGERGVGYAQPLPVLGRKSRIAEYNRRAISARERERERERERGREERGTEIANKFINQTKKQRKKETHNRNRLPTSNEIRSARPRSGLN